MLDRWRRLFIRRFLEGLVLANAGQPEASHGVGKLTFPRAWLLRFLSLGTRVLVR